jgi:hypothetical protein
VKPLALTLPKSRARPCDSMHHKSKKHNKLENAQIALRRIKKKTNWADGGGGWTESPIVATTTMQEWKGGGKAGEGGVLRRRLAMLDGGNVVVDKATAGRALKGGGWAAMESMVGDGGGRRTCRRRGWRREGGEGERGRRRETEGMPGCAVPPETTCFQRPAPRTFLCQLS